MLTLLLILLAAGPLLLAVYLGLLTASALLHRACPPPAGPADRRFAILIPAHNEEALIGRLLQNLQQLDYPTNRFQAWVVADNCVDGTASAARSFGARVHERSDTSRKGKGFALAWLLEQIRATGYLYDAYIVLDADSVVAPNFLRSMDARLESGSRVIQAYYSVLNAGESPVAALRYAALAAVHYLRPLGRSRLGLSCGLKGNGMCFSAAVLDQFSWSWFTLAEDAEFHLALVREGIRVEFAPETSVLADMPITLAQAASQNERWEQGRLHLVRQWAVRILASGMKRKSVLHLDAVIEQIIPPLSVPFALSVLCLLISIPLEASAPIWLAALGLIGLALYLLVGLLLVRAPLKAYISLSYAPMYIVWKIALYARALAAKPGAEWIRTPRHGALTILSTQRALGSDAASARRAG